MKFLNLTPHPITIVEGEQSTVYPVDGPAPRLAVEREALGQIGGISVVRSTMGEPTGLPEPQDGVIIIVSALVAEHASVAGRADLAYPGEAIRDPEGKIVGAKGLCAGPGLARQMLEKDLEAIAHVAGGYPMDSLARLRRHLLA